MRRKRSAHAGPQSVLSQVFSVVSDDPEHPKMIGAKAAERDGHVFPSSSQHSEETGFSQRLLQVSPGEYPYAAKM